MEPMNIGLMSLFLSGFLMGVITYTSVEAVVSLFFDAIRARKLFHDKQDRIVENPHGD